MPRSRPATTGYERLAQADADEYSSESDVDELIAASPLVQSSSIPRYAPITRPPPRGTMSPRAASTYTSSSLPRPAMRRRVGSSSGGVDIKAINARLERWAEEIAARFKRGRKNLPGGADEEKLEIHHSVFQPPQGVRPVTAGSLSEAQQHDGEMTKAEFDEVVESVRAAIRQELHPSMISQGSSGSYFARDPDGKIVGVFKPKDEEPYAAGNPKWNKWIHRNLFPCCFGRACLIPNLSYVSEAAAYVLDCQLRTHLVPYTDVVWLSSKSFHYPYWDRRAFHRKKRPLPDKPGSFQVFLKGFKDANVFLREHPWPDQYWSGFRANDANRGKKKRRWTENCRPGSATAYDGADSSYGSDDESEVQEPGPNNFVWTESLKQSFREELEKLVILDYIMRNTDRGLDNWMIKVDWETGQVSIVSDPAHMNLGPVSEEEVGPRPVALNQASKQPTTAPYPYRSQKPMDASNPRSSGNAPAISIGAIDNSLSWPWKHPDAWRSFPFGWLFLPVDLIGRPFSQKTRDHFLPLLTSTAWWSQTQMALKKVFQVDVDFQERMFAKQIAVMKGQAWNVVEALKTPDHGPLELTRRTKVCVWDDLVDIPVAVPMRDTSIEQRRIGSHPRQSMDEADIAGSAPVNRTKVEDLLGLASSPAGMPHPGRFEIPNPLEEADVGAVATSDAENTTEVDPSTPSHKKGSLSVDRPRPSVQPQRNMASYQGPSRGLNTYEPARLHHSPHLRRFSFATAAARRNSHGTGDFYYDGDDLEGDLGYTAAEGQMGNQRRVIVERIELVKTRRPVFTWC